MQEKKTHVQHISGKGRKWELDPYETEGDEDWCVKSVSRRTVHHLPRSEYRLVSPPVKVWVNVSKEVAFCREGRQLEIAGDRYCLPEGYRWAWTVAGCESMLLIQRQEER